MTTLARRRAARPARETVVLLLALVLVALNLRPAIASVPPLLGVLQADLGLSGPVAGALTTLPVLCMSLFAPVGTRLARRLGRERALAGALGLLAAGTLVRGVAPATPPLFAGTLLAGAGLAMASALLPGLVKAYFPDRAGTVTGVYTAALAGGAMGGAALTVPLMDAYGGRWQLSLASWTLLALLALAVWVPVTAGRRQAGRQLAPERAVLPWRSWLAWRVSLFMGLQSLLFYSALTWFAPSYVALGWTKASAGLLFAVSNAVQVVSAITLPAISDRTRDRRPYIGLAVGTITVTFIGLAFAPLAAPVLWAVLFGLGVGGTFGLALALLVDLAPDPRATEGLSGMAFLIGYAIAAGGPVLAGALHDASGGYRLPYLVLAGFGVLTIAVGVSIRPPRQKPGTLSPRDDSVTELM
jgi:CP family cyanate transporter-like MFS transporter